MCATCGCSGAGGAVLVTARVHAHAHEHDHDHDHDHDHADGRSLDHEHPIAAADARTVLLERALLAKNDDLAKRNRAWCAARDILALNLVSSPGSGKTTLLERTIRDVGASLALVVIEGDQATENDSDRIRAAGARALQVNTGTGCHLEAETVGRALRLLAPQPHAVVMIENVGNLVCPALFDLGERAKVAILSVTEGDDKPAKYPHMFAAADLVIINKIDLLPYVDFDVDRCIAHARNVRPDVETIVLSARSGDNMLAWYEWIERKRVRDAASPRTR